MIDPSRRATAERVRGRRARLFVATVGCALGLADPAWPEALSIANAGFEAPYQGIEVPTGAFPVGAPPDGWTRYDLGGSPVSGSLVGVLNPGTQADYDADGGGLPPCFPGGAPEGDNVALLFKNGPASADEYGIEQVLSDVLEPETTYTLTVEVGNIQTCSGLAPGYRTTYDLEGFPGYRIELRAGATMLAFDEDGLAPAEGEFETSSIELSVPAAHPQLGQPLTIRLVNRALSGTGGHLEVDFDDVRLDANASAEVPLAPWLGGAVSIFVGLTGALRARRRRAAQGGPQGDPCASRRVPPS